METTPSAFRHGIAIEDMRHAVEHPYAIHPEDEELTMVIGWARNGRLLEIGISERSGEPRIVHAMPARRRYYRR